MVTYENALAAERYFLEAAAQALGLRIIKDKASEAPGTIRKTVEGMPEAVKVDFIVVLQTGDRVKVELTLISKSGTDKRHREKRRNHREGKVLLAWLPRMFANKQLEVGEADWDAAQEASLQWLREAAKGEYEAFTTFRHWLKQSIREFLERQASN